MTFVLPKLPFMPSQVEGWLSPETLDYHHGKHHRAYVEKLNTLLRGTALESADLEEIILKANGSLFNNAAQSWNHMFYWLGIGGNRPFASLQSFAQDYPTLSAAIDQSFGSLPAFQNKFSTACAELFGSGWVWLAKNSRTQVLEVVSTPDAGNPMTQDLVPLLVCDVWEHAYYIDFRNSRERYVAGFLDSIRWNFVAENLHKKKARNLTQIMTASSSKVPMNTNKAYRHPGTPLGISQ